MGEMMASPSELSLECKPQSYSMLLKSSGDQPAQVPHRPTGSTAPPHTDRHGHPAQKLEEYIAGLEAERLKIDAFKRELPLCIELISNAMEASRQQLQSYKSSQSKCPVLEEFIPLKNSNSGGADDQKPAAANHSSDKANWMTTAQLWSCQASNNDHAAKNQPISPKETEISLSVSPNLALDDNNQRNGGGAFLPFTKERNIGTGPAPTIQALSDLALASSDRRMDGNKCSENNGNRGFSGSRSEIEAKAVGNGIAGRSYTDTQTSSTKSADAAAAATTTSASQTHRKQRRCWSPDLHRRFVNALQMLGGSQVATPKQIRELMKVDGLTNDEVKSHLQKYRLHTRRPSPSPQSTGAPAPQLFVLGSIWVPPEYATAAATAHGGAPTIYGTHPTSQVSPHYCNSPVPQEFHHPYSLPQPQSQALHHHHHPVIHQHQQLHVFKAASQQVHSSPDSDGRGGGDRSESIEDGKSESSSWKAESGGENIGGEVRKKLATDEESNGSEITLKF